MKENGLRYFVPPALLVVAGWLASSSPAITANEVEVSRWITSLRDPARRLEMAYAFPEAIGQDRLAVTSLLRALEDPDPFIRQAAAAALGESTTEPAELVPSLVKALSDRAYGVDQQAAIALTKIGEPAVPALGKVLAAEMRAGPPAVIYPGLCNDIPSGPGFNAAVALGDIGTPSIGTLLETLRLPPRADLGFTTYQVSLMALARIGTPAVAELARSQTDSNRRFRLLTAIALARIRADLKAARKPTTEIDRVAGTVTANLVGEARNPLSRNRLVAIRALG